MKRLASQLHMVNLVLGRIIFNTQASISEEVHGQLLQFGLQH